jgi:hypothetical protein
MRKTWWLLVWVAGCAGDKATVVEGETCEVLKDFESPVFAADLLFVVDRSAAMAGVDLGPRLASAMRYYLADNIYPYDLHVGVIASDPAGEGRFVAPFIIYAPQPGGWVETNIDGDLADAVAAVASLGDSGDAHVEPLAMMARAVDPSNTANAGFLRENALLTVVFIANEDDASPDPVASYFALLPHDTLASAILSCDVPTPRLAPLAFSSSRICDPSWDGSVPTPMRLTFVESPCVRTDAVDLDPVMPGLQIDCSVFDATYERTISAIPRCPMAATATPMADAPHPCWWVEKESSYCPYDGMLLMHFERDTWAPAQTFAQAICSGPC